MKSFRVGILAALILCALAFARTSHRMPAELPTASSALAAGLELPVSASTSQEAVASQAQDFDTRCHAPGVLVCQGFDSPVIAEAAKWPGAGLYPAGDKLIHGTFDRSQKSSGEGSLRFEIPSHSGANAAGYWRQPFGKSFGEGSTFYVQFRERFSPEMLKNDWAGTTWKQAIFHNGGSTCADVELTTVQYYHSGFPIMYTDCGARSLVTNGGNTPYQHQQGDYNCWYGNINPKNCFLYPANQWVTFYYQVSIGHWGMPDSTINAWVGLDGKPLKQWIKMPRFILKNEHPGQDYDCVTLLTYMTNKDAGAALPVAYAWYDELIVSTQPIASPAPSAAPAP